MNEIMKGISYHSMEKPWHEDVGRETDAIQIRNQRNKVEIPALSLEKA
jgi:hypothetical protein